MSTEIVKANTAEIEVAKITDAELKMHLNNLGLMKDLSEGEQNSFISVAKAFNLNPFKREIYVSKYGGQPASIITGYEVYIKRAERSGVLDGWEVKTEGEIKPVLRESTLKAIITIYRKDRSRPFVWEVKFTEYMQLKDGNLNKFWQKSETMIKKVAMAQGFRLCFSDELGGMPYTIDEMPAIEVTTPISVTNAPIGTVGEKPTVLTKKPITQPQFDKVIERVKSGEDIKQKTKDSFNLTPVQIETLDKTKVVLNKDTFESMIEMVKTGERMKDGVTSFYTFLINDCELTEAQLAEVEAVSQPM